MHTKPLAAPEDRPPLSPRLQRLIRALLAGPIYREQADRVARASNSPQCISVLRQRFHLKITTTRVKVIDKDGLASYPGIYLLEPESRLDAELILALC